MKFWNVRIGTAVITVMASTRGNAVAQASNRYRERNNLPVSFDVTGLYRGTEERKFQPGDRLPAGC